MTGKHSGELSDEECDVVSRFLEDREGTSNVVAVTGKGGMYVQCDVDQNGLKGVLVINDIEDDPRDSINQ